MSTKEIRGKSKFHEIFTKALETLPPRQLRAYHLSLLGWMNQEIAEELQIQVDQVSLLLSHARKQIKDFIQKSDGYSSKDSHQEIIALQKEDPELLSESFFSKYSRTTDAKQKEQKIEPMKKIELIGEVKDACIQAGYENKNIFRVAELLEFPFSEKEKQELQEQLEEYQAAQEGLERLSDSRTNFDIFWNNKILPHWPSGKVAAVTAQIPIWQRIRYKLNRKKAAFIDQLQERLPNHILNFQQARAAQAGPQVPFELPSLEFPNVKILIYFTRSEADGTQGQLYLGFQPRDNSNSKALDGIRLTLCDLEGKPIKPRKQAKIREQLATFIDVDLTKKYTVQVS